MSYFPGNNITLVRTFHEFLLKVPNFLRVVNAATEMPLDKSKTLVRTACRIAFEEPNAIHPTAFTTDNSKGGGMQKKKKKKSQSHFCSISIPIQQWKLAKLCIVQHFTPLRSDFFNPLLHTLLLDKRARW